MLRRVSKVTADYARGCKENDEPSPVNRSSEGGQMARMKEVHKRRTSLKERHHTKGRSFAGTKQEREILAVKHLMASRSFFGGHPFGHWVRNGRHTTKMPCYSHDPLMGPWSPNCMCALPAAPIDLIDGSLQSRQQEVKSSRASSVQRDT